MIKLATTSDILSSILANKRHLWNKMLNTQPISTIVLLDNGRVIQSDMDPLFTWVTAHNIEVLSSKESSVKIKENKAVEQLDALYLLDISPESAKEIRTLFGVFCAPVSANPKKILNYHTIAYTSDRKNGNYKWKNWDSVFSKHYNGPSNALIIVDRWFFDNVKGDTNNLQRSNLFDLLNSILPQGHFSCQYQILMFVEHPQHFNKIVDISWAKQIIKVVKHVIEDLKEKREYDIYFEIVMNNKSGVESQARDNTHNRDLFTNYSYFTCQKDLRIFSQDNPPKGATLTFEELLYVNADELGSEHYESKLSDLQIFINNFIESRYKHIKNSELNTFMYAWIVNDKIFMLQQRSDGYTTGIKEIGEDDNIRLHDVTEKFMIENRLIKRFLPNCL